MVGEGERLARVETIQEHQANLLQQQTRQIAELFSISREQSRSIDRVAESVARREDAAVADRAGALEAAA